MTIVASQPEDSGTDFEPASSTNKEDTPEMEANLVSKQEEAAEAEAKEEFFAEMNANLERNAE